MVEWRNFVGLLPEGLIIAFVSLLGYVVAYFYQLKYFRYFGIPRSFISLSVTDIVFAIVAVSAAWAVVLYITLELFLFKRISQSVYRWAFQKGWRVTISVVIGVLMIFSLYIPMLTGYLAARIEEVYLVTNTSPEMVVLYKGGDNLICAPFDRKEKKVYRRFTILRLDKESMPVLSPQKVGPLSVVE